MRRLHGNLHLIRCSAKGLIQVKVSPNLSEKKARKWMWVGLAAFVALQIYFVHRAGQWSIGWAGQRARPAIQLARRGLALAEDLSKKPFRRPRSETAQ